MVKIASLFVVSWMLASPASLLACPGSNKAKAEKIKKENAVEQVMKEEKQKKTVAISQQLAEKNKKD